MSVGVLEVAIEEKAETGSTGPANTPTTPTSQQRKKKRRKKRKSLRQLAQEAAPRLLSLHQAAKYLGVSYWSIRDYVIAGHIPSVSMPALKPREGARQTGPSLRRVLIDRCDLDRFIESRKQQ
jgi:hypothetical protein